MDIEPRLEVFESHLKNFFMLKIGSTWNAASAANSISKLNSHTDSRGQVPWMEVQACMQQHGNNSVPACVAKHARNLTESYYTWNP